jgi:hypothetical protein
MLSLFTLRHDLICLHNTITDEAAIIDLLNTRTNAEIVSTTVYYYQSYGDR